MIFEIQNYAALRKAIDELCAFLESERVTAERIFDSRLVMSELLGNVFRHSDGSARLHGYLRDGFVEIAVYASVPFEPPKTSRCPETNAENGRGLFLVDSVCVERTFTPDGGIVVKIKTE